MPAGKKRKPAAREDTRLPAAPRPAAPSRTIPSTEAQNEFGRILDQAAADHDIAITRHNVVRAVLVSAARYRQLVGGEEQPDLDALEARFDKLYASMQSANVRDGTARAVDARPDEMARAAVAAVKHTPAKRTARRRHSA